MVDKERMRQFTCCDQCFVSCSALTLILEWLENIWPIKKLVARFAKLAMLRKKCRKKIQFHR